MEYETTYDGLIKITPVTDQTRYYYDAHECSDDHLKRRGGSYIINRIVPSGRRYSTRDELRRKRAELAEKKKRLDNLTSRIFNNADGDYDNRRSVADMELLTKPIEDLHYQITVLEDFIQTATIINDDNKDTSKIAIMSIVKFINLSNFNEMEFRIVVDADSDFQEKKLSCMSPIGSALIGHTIGDIVEVHTPSGKKYLKILAIS